MTSFDEGADNLTQMLRQFLAAVRKHAAKDGADDPVERILAAATIGIAAVMVAWPNGRKLPKFAALLVNIGRQVWARRSWWIEP